MSEPCFIGLMSGTSMDGIDVAAVSFAADNLAIVNSAHHPYPAELKSRLTELLSPDWKGGLQALLELDYLVGQAFADSAQAIMSDLPETIRVNGIGMHGQTIFHLPDGDTPASWQMGNAAVVSERTGVSTVSDWRRRDMAAGGQGAPLTPAFHRQFLSRSSSNSCVLNLGGIANITLLDHQGRYLGFDTGPANTLMDKWIQQGLGRSYDQNGEWAASGSVDANLLNSMLSDTYFSENIPKSTGLEHFNLEWLQEHLDQSTGTKPADEDIQRTLLELTAVTVTDAIKQHDKLCNELYVCGGGVHNLLLQQRLKDLLPTSVIVNSTDVLGIDPDLVEAAAFAWFARETLAGRKIDVSSATGASGARMLGAIYPA